MAKLTVLEMLNRVFRLTSRPTVRGKDIEEGRLDDDQQMVLDLMRQRQDRIAKNFKWTELKGRGQFDTETGTDKYILSGEETSDEATGVTYRPLPKGIQWIDESTTNVFDPLEQLNDTEWRDLGVNDTGEPDFWRLYRVSHDANSQGFPIVQLHPEPDSVFTYDYEFWAQPPDLVNHDDITPLDDDVLMWGTAMDVLAYDNDPTFEQALANYQRALKDARGNENSGYDLVYGAEAKQHRKLTPRQRALGRVDLPLGG